MADQRILSDLERDALREVANIGAGHAATALSQMTSRKIMISVPEVSVRRLEEVAELVGPSDSVIAGVLMHVMGDLTGRTLVVLDQESAYSLCELLLRRPRTGQAGFDAMEQSTIKETGNILCSAYMNALSDFLGMMLVPSVPALVVDLAGAVLTTAYLNFGHERDALFCVETTFRIDGSERTLTGQFLLMPDPPALQAIFDSIRIAN
ncbi:MAG TPA: chemotaxis protein CheC [Gemmatimonadales bacterium]|jgi:chemotaxis protein CheC|nr:chemotaxis protein CheC [Gemmatimonadales bacterium]